MVYRSSYALQLIAVLQVYNSILLRLTRSCILVPPCTVAFALLFAVSFTLVFVKSSCVEIRNSSNSYGSHTVPHRIGSNGVLCLCVLSLYLVDLNVRLHHDVIMQEFELFCASGVPTISMHLGFSCQISCYY